MSDQLLTQLTDFGALGIFAAFLLYQHFTMQRKIDGLIERFQQQINEIRKDGEQQEEKLRDRYDVVVGKYEAEGRELRDGLAKAVEANSRKLDATLETLNRCLETR